MGHIDIFPAEMRNGVWNGADSPVFPKTHQAGDNQWDAGDDPRGAEPRKMPLYCIPRRVHALLADQKTYVRSQTRDRCSTKRIQHNKKLATNPNSGLERPTQIHPRDPTLVSLSRHQSILFHQMPQPAPHPNYADRHFRYSRS